MTHRTTTPLADRFGRNITYARIAVTCACNLRCAYCLSEEHDGAASSGNLMSTGDIERLISTLARLGINKIRFTGGEPLLREDIAELVAAAKRTPGINTVSLTTNGVLLHRHIDALLDAGLDALNLSIDTLDRDRYRTITRRDRFDQVKENLESLLARQALPVKLNIVMMRGINSDEIGRFMEYTRNDPVTVRFMELQPFDDHQIWRTGRFLGLDRIQELLTEACPELSAHRGSSTEYFSFSLPGSAGSAAIIPAYTRNFCSDCNRIRVTADGAVISCLYDKHGVNLLPLLQRQACFEEIAALFMKAAEEKPENGKREGRRGTVRTSMSEIGG
jgi:cyclic pyranopterin phosphate synthase